MATLTSEPTPLLVKRLAREAGFDGIGIASAQTPWEAGHRLREFVDNGRHGSMGWMETTLERRSHPNAMWPEAKTAIMLGVNYGPDLNPMEKLKARTIGNISCYAGGDDYHDVVKKALKAFAGQVHRLLKCEVKVFVDTAPLMEKPLAARAGLGWQGKHTNLVSREFGSWLFLGCVLIAAHIEPDAPEVDHCGTCTACLDVCPTEAFPAPYQLDARRCISYLTIEHDGPIPEPMRALMGNRIYGCDDCLAICPWNKFASAAREVKLQVRQDLVAPSLETLSQLDDAAFRALFAKNPVKRISVGRFLRNVAIAIGNSGDQTLIDCAMHLSVHEQSIVRGAAVWALKQLLDAAAFAILSAKRGHLESDDDVRAEWASL